MMNKTERGYTLVEMLVVIAVATLALASVVSSVLMFYRSNQTTLNQAYAVENARRGTSRLLGDMRGIDFGANGAYPLASMGSAQFVFYVDTSGDGVAEKVEYLLSGTSLMRTVTLPVGSPPVYSSENAVTTTAAFSVRNTARALPVFRFYTANSTEITIFPTTTPVAYVATTLVVNEDETATEGDYILRGVAALRNSSNF